MVTTEEIAPVNDGGKRCILHAYHWPRPLVLVVHHVQPKGMGGPDVAGNRALVCDTGHRNVHTLMGPLVNVGIMPRGGTRRERELAREGFDRWVAAGRPGNPHAAYGLARHV
jgi:hypothetical protein